MNALTIFLYLVSDVCLAGVAWSYYLSYRVNVKEDRQIFMAMFLFTLAMLTVNLVATTSNIITFATGVKYTVPYVWTRPLIIALSSSYLLYTSWRKN